MAKNRSLDQAIAKAAVTKLASKSPDQVLKEFREQGIGSLEDLAKLVVQTAKSASRGSAVAFDPELFPVCYKFTTARPRLSDQDIRTVTNALKEVIR